MSKATEEKRVPRFEGTKLHLMGFVAHLDERGQYAVPADQMRAFVAYVDACQDALDAAFPAEST